jgi:hypothetical protein
MPSWGSWVTYALGSENRNLPAYVVLSDPGGLPVDGERNWTAGWLPAVYQGTPFRSGKSPVLNLQTPEGVSPAARRSQLDFLGKLNRAHLERHPENSELSARLANFETAARMQTAVPGVLDISGETAETRALYGLDNAATAEYGTRCLLARRLVEQGVRFSRSFKNSALGHPQPQRRESQGTVLDDRSAQRRAGARFEAPRSARFDDRDVDRRIRTLANLAGCGRSRS